MDSSVSAKDEIWFLARVPSRFKRSLHGLKEKTPRIVDVLDLSSVSTL